MSDRVPGRQRIVLDDRAMQESTDAVTILAEGAAVLAPVLSPAGFAFQQTRHGRGSGGDFATGRFIRGSQYLELHVRHSLGLVTYGWCGDTLCHADYLRGLRASGAYPGYSSDPVDAFRHLAQDLAGPLSGFLDGDHGGYQSGLQAAMLPYDQRLP